MSIAEQAGAYKVQETAVGTWLVGGAASALDPSSVAVWLYPSGVWKCGSCGPLVQLMFRCLHVQAVRRSGLATICAYPETAFCHEIACGEYKIEGVDVPLCPDHAHLVEKSVA